MSVEVPVVDPADHLLAWVRGRDVPCPVCGYNLRDLTRPVCPECRHGVVLTVGVLQPRLGWLFVALAPGAFSGIAAVLLLVPMILFVTVDPAPWPFVAVEAFGWLSAAAAVILFRQRNVFIRQGRGVRAAWALGIWAVHVAAFAAFWAAVSLI